MNLLQLFFIISGVVIFILALDIARRQKFNALHFVIFLWIWCGLLVFTFFPWVLDAIWSILGLQRGADALVYGSIIFLLYFALLLLRKVEENREDLTKLVREIALINSKKTIITGKEIILVRVFNEGSVLKTTIQNILDAGYKNILVVNDGSKDNSAKILDTFWKKIHVISHYKNRWAGAALETGFEYLRRYSDIEYIITFDADGQHDIKDAKKFIKKADKHTNLWAIFGSRFLKNTKSNVPVFRKIILFLGRIFTLIVSGASLTDSHNGYRLFRISTIEKVYLNLDGMAYASQLIEEINKNKIPFSEVPVTVSYTDYSLSKWQKSSNAINIALKFIWSKFFR